MLQRALLLIGAAVVAGAASITAFAGEIVEPPVPTVLSASDEEVKILLDAVEKAQDEKDYNMLAAALLDMETRRHESFEEIIEDCIDHRDEDVQARAIRAAASHEMEDLSKDILKILKKSKKKRKSKKDKDKGDVSGYVAAAAIDYVARMAIEGVEKEVLEHFERIYLVESRMTSDYAPDVVRAAVHYLGQMKYMPVVPKLVDLIREPYPENPNSPSNPPASYWEARYKIWQASEGWLRWGLKEITEQEFRTHREWEAWVSANEKKFK